MSSIFNNQNIERMRVNSNEIALAKINGKVVFQKNKLLKTFFGDSKQETTQGYNELEPKMATATRYGITCTNNGDGSFTLNGTATSEADFRINQSVALGTDNLMNINGEYTLKCDELIEGVRLSVVQNETFSFKLSINSNEKIKNFNFENAENCFIVLFVNSGTTLNNLTIKPLFYKGTEDKPYEPYTGGKPSPSPDYPQKISSINGVNLKLVGKNLFDKNTQNFINGFLSDTRNTIVDSNNVKTFFIPCNPNSIYTISKQKGGYFRVATTIYEPSLGISLSQIIVNNNSSSITINTNNDSKYLLFNVYDKTQDFVSESDMLNSIQLEKGSQVTTYEPYKTQNIPINLQNNILAKVGDYADELQVYSNGDIKILKKTGSFILKGNENWIESSRTSLTNYVSTLDLETINEKIKYNTSSFCKVNYFSRVDISSLSNEIGFELYTEVNSSYKYLGISMDINKIKNIQDFKEWLSTNNTKFLYQLSELESSIKIQNIKEELNSFGDYSNIEIETTYE